METTQTNYLYMAISTDDVCGDNEAIWTTLPAYETARVIIDRPATREDDDSPPAPQPT